MEQKMSTVVLLGTGGTIATRTDAAGDARASDSGAALVESIGDQNGVKVISRDVLVVNSFRMSLTDMADLAYEVRRALKDPEVAGVVITHGTDTTEETAYFLDLVHNDDRPVVVTGAQRAADATDPDGPSNLANAVALAADPEARGLGVVVVFNGEVHAATGVRKVHTLRLDGFGSPETGPLGRMEHSKFLLGRRPERPVPLDLDALDLNGWRVDIVPYYPGADTTAMRSLVAAGARGIVLEATGAGNANPAFVELIAELAESGVVVGLTTRVHAGPVAPIYSDGGGADLQEAGAILLGTLRASQARVLLLVLLGTLGDSDRTRVALAERSHA